MSFDLEQTDKLLSTTRAVRRRLDLERDVPDDLLLRCIELATGKVMWSEPRLTRASLLYVDGHFVCLSEDGTLRLIRVNCKKYDLVAELVWREAGQALLMEPAWAAPVLSHGLLYVRGENRLVCLDLIPARK